MPGWTQALFPVVAGFIGIFVGAWLTTRRERSGRKHQFLLRQLNDLYAPLVGLHMEIRVRNELRVRIQKESDAVWRSLAAEDRQLVSEARGRLLEERRAEFRGIVAYDNRTLAEEMIPAYRRMLTTLRDNLWLAEPETRQYFPPLLEFVELWERWLAKTMPHEVLTRLQHGEEALGPFYDHLENIHSQLRAAVSRGDVALR